MTELEIKEKLRGMTGYSSVFVPEFTWGNLRIDALIIDLAHRWIRGFEIKIRRQDFLKDEKWTMYSSFCSSLSIVCPAGLIGPEEIKKPFGLLWIDEDAHGYVQWKKRPKRFQRRDSLAWLWTYVRVLEWELPRLDGEARWIAEEVKRLHNANLEKGD